MSQPTVKYRGRFSGVTKDVYKLLVYEGKKRVGGILLIEGLSPYSRKDINNSPCPDDVKALISRGADPKASMWDVDGAFLDEHLHNKGIGKEMYRRAFAAIAKKKGPIFVHPTYCKLGSGTSAAARRVWKSLRPEYMSSGDVFYLSDATTKRKNPSLKSKITAYHGAVRPWKNKKPDLKYVGSGRGRSAPANTGLFWTEGEAELVLGPGLYFSSKKEQADAHAFYGTRPTRYTVEIDTRGIYNPLENSPKKLQNKVADLLVDLAAVYPRKLASLKKDMIEGNISREEFEDQYGIGPLGIVFALLGRDKGRKALREIGVTGQAFKLEPMEDWGSQDPGWVIAVYDTSIVKVLKEEKLDYDEKEAEEQEFENAYFESERAIEFIDEASTPAEKKAVKKGIAFFQKHADRIRREYGTAYDSRNKCVRYVDQDEGLEPSTKRKNPSLKVPHEKQMFKTREYKQAFQKFYKGRRGAEGSRFTPIEFDAAVLKVGNWRIDDAKGLYGREIDQLCEFDPHSLEPSEVLSQVREGDAGRYAGWMEEGLEPPPIEVVETDKGTLKVVDGHRRLHAAKLLGLPIKAWVSWNAKPYGGGASSGLTYELAKR